MAHEYIICAAIWYKDLPTQAHLPRNIDKGIVIAGWRHGNCIATMSALGKLRSVTFGPNSVGENVQGFITSTGRFVDRDEAGEIAAKAGQIEKPKHLFSEDLY
jgi:hypothetical protein